MSHDSTQSEKGIFMIKGALSGLRQFLATVTPLKIMKNAIHFIAKAVFCSKDNSIKPELNKQKEHVTITMSVRLSFLPTYFIY